MNTKFIVKFDIENISQNHIVFIYYDQSPSNILLIRMTIIDFCYTYLNVGFILDMNIPHNNNNNIKLQIVSSIENLKKTSVGTNLI